MTAKPYWRSLAELADAPEFRAFLEAEFPTEADPAGISRRRWLQLMGASLALAGVAGCRWEKAEILPYVSQPTNRTPGQPLRFATAMDLSGSAIGLLVTSIDGRPIKIEGNPKHPASLGATDLLAQAAILELYDPDRSQTIYESSGTQETARTWDEFSAFARPHVAEHKKTGGAGLRILSEVSSSPTLAALRAQFLKAFPQARWYEYEPLFPERERAGAKLAYGQPYHTHLALDKARVILCLDADPLGTPPAAVRYARDFARGRGPADGHMSRLYAVESCFSITGSMADHRLPLRSEHVAWFTEALHRELARNAGSAGAPAEKQPSASDDKTAQALRFARAVARDLKKHQGESVVVVGPRQPAEVHALVHEINAALGNVGKTVTYTAEPEPDRPSPLEAIQSLMDEIRQSKVKTLVVLGGNPVYDAPADLEFAKAYQTVPTQIHLGLYRNETARSSAWHVPQAHFLESWGDARAFDGTYSVVQPLIAPLYSGKSAIELVTFLLGQDAKGYDLVRGHFKEMAGQGWEGKWSTTLDDGLLAESRWPTAAPKLARKTAPAASAETELPASLADMSNGKLEIVFCRSAVLYDGRFANNSWLQELPDSMTKLTWDNAALLSPATAKAMRVEHGTLVKLEYEGRTLEIPAYVMPGQAPGSVAVILGYGRTAAGRVGGSAADHVPPVGANAYTLRTSRAMEFGKRLAVNPTARSYPLALTQDHHAIDTVGLKARAKRLGALIREASLKHYQEHPEFAKHAVEHPPLESLWKENEYGPHRWGMTIDLTKCIGCNACAVACQAENNVPVVGKERVLRGREMHWVRVDRYFQGDPDDPRAVHQVVACHHCENAPCEQVCPVGATVHSHEGLNDMVYNRCVGTRYCANNCPYKVRRFNFFNYHKDLEDPENEVLKMVYNPEVTVRSRGVMEKCTYCVQRIQAAKIDAKNHRRPIRDGEITTACQQVCPAEAIVFGDLADPESQVSKLQALDRAYGMLAELNVKPRTNYLARIRNPNPELKDTGHDHDRATG